MPTVIDGLRSLERRPSTLLEGQHSAKKERRDGNLVVRIEPGGGRVRDGSGADGPPRGDPPDRPPVARASGTLESNIAMATIVRYIDQLRPANDYPYRIISPGRPSACCDTTMIQIGDLQVEGSGLYYYKRCRRCGFTVRHFLPCPSEELRETIPEVGGVLKFVAMARDHAYAE